jgi:hypothetical protein
MTVLWTFACVYSTPNHANHRSRFRYRPRPRFPAFCTYTYTYSYTYTYPCSRNPRRPRHDLPPFPPSCTGTCTASLGTRTFLGPTRDWVPRAGPYDPLAICRGRPDRAGAVALGMRTIECWGDDGVVDICMRILHAESREPSIPIPIPTPTPISRVLHVHVHVHVLVHVHVPLFAKSKATPP